MSSTQLNTTDNIVIQEILASEVSQERSKQLDIEEEKFQEGLLQSGWEGKLHCAAAGYMSRPLLYKNGLASYIYQAVETSDSVENILGTYVVSVKDIWFDGQKMALVFGYLARVLPAARNKGLGQRFFVELAKECTLKGIHISAGVIACTNVPQLRANIKTSAQTGQGFLGEQGIYVLSKESFPTIPIPADIAVQRIDSVEEIDALHEHIFGKDEIGFLGEQGIYVLSKESFPTIPIPADIAVQRIDSVEEIDALHEHIFGKD